MQERKIPEDFARDNFMMIFGKDKKELERKVEEMKEKGYYPVLFVSYDFNPAQNYWFTKLLKKIVGKDNPPVYLAKEDKE